MSHSIEWRCPSCQHPHSQELDATDHLSCPECGHRQHYTEGTLGPAGAVVDPVGNCIVCGYERMFSQKDFNRKLGLLIVVIGAVLSPWTYGLSLVVCMGLDYGLYFFVPEITVCYGCDGIYRGFENNPKHRAHDPLLADRYRREAPGQPDTDTDVRPPAANET